MQIKCSKDIGGWFDELAIFEVKIVLCKGPKQQQNRENFNKLAAEIKDCVGKDKFDEIINSNEYFNLYDFNIQIFNLVDKLNNYNKNGNLENWEIKDTGLEINDLNYNRYLAKINLQKKFFNTEIKETKIGYE